MQTIIKTLAAAAKKLGLKLTLALAILGILALMAPPARAQVSPTSIIVITNIPAIITTNLSTTFALNPGLYAPTNPAAGPIFTNGIQNGVIPLTKNCALALALRWYTTNGPAVVGVGGSFGLDGTNFGLAPFTLVGTAFSNAPVASPLGLTNGCPVTISTNWTQNTLSGYAFMVLNVFTNTASGTSAVYNASSIASRPTLNTQTY